MNYVEDLHNLHLTDTPASKQPQETPPASFRIGKSVNGRQVFVVDKPTALFDKIFAQFQGAIEALDAKCNYVFQHVHQRRCEPKQIESEFAKWSSEISVLDKTMIKLWAAACLYAKAVRNEPEASEFFCLHMYATGVSLTKTNLQSILGDDGYKAWLAAYKSSPEEGKKAVAQDFLAKVTLESPLQPTLQYLKDAQSYDKLPYENGFRTGTTGASTFWWSIKGQTDALTGVAKALHKLEGEYKDLLRRVCQQDQSVDLAVTMHQVSLGLIHIVCEQVKVLTTTPDKHEPHAALDYANALIEQGKALSGKILELASLSKNHMGKILQALEFLKSAKSVDGLYDAITFIRDLSTNHVESKMLYEVLEHTLIKIGQQVCTLTHDEEIILERLVSKKHTLQELEKDVKFYLMKRFIQNIFFCEEIKDPQLDCVLHILQTDAVYRSQLANLLGAEGPLRQLYNSYVAYAKLKSQKELHAVMIAILGQLQAPDDLPVEMKYMRLRRAEEALNALEQEMDAKHAKFVFIKHIFHTRKAEWDKEISKFKKCDNEGQIVLYGHLSSRLFSQSAEIRLEAEKAIIRIVNQPNMITARIPEVLKLLLKAWAIERLVTERKYCREHTLTWGAPTLTKYEQGILEGVVIEYLSDTEKRLFWHAFYDIGFMELLVQDYKSKYEAFVTHGKRCDKNFVITNTVLNIYRKFRDLVENNQLFHPDSNKPTELAQDLYVQLKECFDKKTDIKGIEITDPKEYSEVSHYLLRQVYNFIYSKQSTF